MAISKEDFEKWEAMVHVKNTSGIVIETETQAGGKFKTIYHHIKPVGSIPQVYSAANIPKYRAMSRAERRF